MIEGIRHQHIHFVGIGGSGMSGIAEVLLNMGYRISGSDIVENEATKKLAALGARIFIGHDSTNVLGADVLVVSSAIEKRNVELLAADERRISIIPRAEMLKELMRLKFGIAISGTHGKTTTTSLICWILAKAGLDPTMVIGGKFFNIGGSARLGQGRYLVAEADESDGSFLKLSPIIAVVTNIDLEHLDYFHGLERIEEAFLEFINNVPFYGKAILGIDNLYLRSLLPRIKKRFVTYGFEHRPQIMAQEIEARGLHSEFNVIKENNLLGRVRINVPGLHYINNALAAIAVGLELEIDFKAIKEAIGSYRNVERRFQILGEEGNILFLDDYAHHPTEIEVTLRTVRVAWPNQRIVTIFQPHRYTRTKFLWKNFAQCFNESDIVIITEIYPAGEASIEGIKADLVVKSVKEAGHPNIKYIRDLDETIEYLKRIIQKGDLVITLGAGDIYRVGQGLLEYLKEKE